jgi:hypothetical protein
MQNMKWEFNKDTDSVRGAQIAVLKMKSSLSQIKKFS